MAVGGDKPTGHHKPGVSRPRQSVRYMIACRRGRVRPTWLKELSPASVFRLDLLLKEPRKTKELSRQETPNSVREVYMQKLQRSRGIGVQRGDGGDEGGDRGDGGDGGE